MLLYCRHSRISLVSGKWQIFLICWSFHAPEDSGYLPNQCSSKKSLTWSMLRQDSTIKSQYFQLHLAFYTETSVMCKHIRLLKKNYGTDSLSNTKVRSRAVKVLICLGNRPAGQHIEVKNGQNLIEENTAIPNRTHMENITLEQVYIFMIGNSSFIKHNVILP